MPCGFFDEQTTSGTRQKEIRQAGLEIFYPLPPLTKNYFVIVVGYNNLLLWWWWYSDNFAIAH